MAERTPDRVAPDGAAPGLMPLDDAIRWLRADPGSARLVADAYLGRDVVDSADRFLASAEFGEVVRIIGPSLAGAVVADIGAGVGIASYAMARSGAARVLAVEPDPSDEVGRGAIERLIDATSVRIEIVDGWGEALPLADGSVDVVYSRQVLHHAAELDRFVAEVARILRPGGVLLACREHVVDNAAQKQAFLAAHPVNRLAGGENAFALDEYLTAIAAAGLALDRSFGPWDSVINAFPQVRSSAELAAYPARRLEEQFGGLGRALARVPGVTAVVGIRVRRPWPGRMYTFLCHKPETSGGSST